MGNFRSKFRYFRSPPDDVFTVDNDVDCQGKEPRTMSIDMNVYGDDRSRPNSVEHFVPMPQPRSGQGQGKIRVRSRRGYQGKVMARSRHDQGKVKAMSRQGKTKIKLRSKQGQDNFKRGSRQG